MGAYTESDKRPVEKIAVWPRETNMRYKRDRYMFLPSNQPMVVWLQIKKIH